jgi:glycosyltransferase involved in cell wall biosynthesis
MRILYFYQYFSTPEGAWGTRVYEFAKEWVEKGHEVIVVSSIYSKSDLKASRFIETQNINGIKVKVIRIYINNKHTFFKRVLSFIGYSIISSYYAFTTPCDVVVASSGPIFVAIPGIIAKVFRNRRFIFEVRDLWPQGAIEMGHLKNQLLIKIAFWTEKMTYHLCDQIIALSPGMVDDIESRYNLKYKTTSVPNAANLDLFRPLNSNIITPQEYKYAIYTGNIGEVNNSLWLLNGAKELKAIGVSEIKIILVGDGQQKQMILDEKKKYDLDNLIILDLMPKSKLIPLIQSSMVSLVPLKDKPILASSSPNKFFESLASGVPIIQNTQGWMKTFLNDNKVGYTIDGNDHKSLVALLIYLSKLPNEELIFMRARCLEIASQFDKNILADKMLSKIISNS